MSDNFRLVLPVFVACLDEAHEQRMRLKWFRLELGVELAAEEVWVVGNLHDLHVSSIRSGSGDPQAGAGEQRFIFAVELIAMAVTLANLGLAIRRLRRGLRLEFAGPCA